MDSKKRLTLAELIERKNQSEEDKLQVKEVYVKNLDGMLVFHRGSISKVIDLMDNIENAESARENYMFQKELIYMHCPMMHNEKLQSAYECVEPMDIVDKLFGENLGAIAEASETILDFYGLADEGEKVKNS